MIATALVIFREILEIALILSVILAATTALPQRNRWIYLGIGGGILGSSLIAFGADHISQFMEGMGQEVVNATIVLLAAAMIGWTVIWMHKHGKHISAKLKKVGNAVIEGEIPLYSLSIIIALSIFREGAEIVLFSYGLLLSGTPLSTLLLGALIGFVGGSLVGAGFYYGLLQMTPKHVFTVTGWLLVLLAAGLAAQGGVYLIAADILPELYAPLWDISHLLPNHSTIGQALNILIGYDARPSLMQFLIYMSVVAMLAFGLIYADRHATK